jgi:hypothetical protein
VISNDKNSNYKVGLKLELKIGKKTITLKVTSSKVSKLKVIMFKNS